MNKKREKITDEIVIKNSLAIKIKRRKNYVYLTFLLNNLSN
jgi:hypothetical protein